MANKNTNPGGGKIAVPGVMNSHDATRARTHARVVDRRDIKDIPCSQTARAAAAKEGLLAGISFGASFELPSTLETPRICRKDDCLPPSRHGGVLPFDLTVRLTLPSPATRVSLRSSRRAPINEK